MTDTLIQKLELLKEYTGPYGIETPEKAIDLCIAKVKEHQPNTLEREPSEIPVVSNEELVKVFNDACPGIFGVPEALDEVIKYYESKRTLKREPSEILDNGGWIKHITGSMPCAPETWVEVQSSWPQFGTTVDQVKYRIDKNSGPASIFDWSRREITSYRVWQPVRETKPLDEGVTSTKREMSGEALDIATIETALRLAEKWLMNCVPAGSIQGPKPLPVIRAALAIVEKRNSIEDGSANG